MDEPIRTDPFLRKPCSTGSIFFIGFIPICWEKSMALFNVYRFKKITENVFMISTT